MGNFDFELPTWCTFGAWFLLQGTVYQFAGTVSDRHLTMIVAKAAKSLEASNNKEFTETVRIDPEAFFMWAEPCPAPRDPIVWDLLLDDVG